MSHSSILVGNPSLDLTNNGLIVPSLQPEMIPVKAILPAPCTQRCPAGIQVKAYVSLIAEGRFGEALEVIRRRCALPGICGRVCHHPCETACKRGAIDEPVAIRALKRFVADHDRDFPRPAPPPGPRRDKSVAVIGSGPAGLTAAYDLSLAGYPVKVFESDGEPGGMLRYGITAYRLPRDVLSAEIEVLVRAGVEIETGRKLGRDFDLQQLNSMGYSATLLAVGAQDGRGLGLEGEEQLSEVEDALAFLRRVNDGSRERVEGHVAVIGGGSTAVEVARTARRLGAASVTILYRRSEDELLAAQEEIRAAQEEGIEFRFLVAPQRALQKGNHFTGLECCAVGLGDYDASGRRKPILIPGSEFVVRASRVFAAVGQEVDLSFLPTRVRTRLTNRQGLVVDPATARTRLSSVFAAGDMVSGPATVIEAIAAGHGAAESIRHYLEEGRPGIREERPEKRAAVEYGMPDTPPVEAARRHPESIPPKPGKEFAEVEQCFTPDEAMQEAKRCLRCGPCGECRACVSSCNRRHVMLEVSEGGNRGETALIRAPASIALSLDEDGTTPARLLPKIRPRSLADLAENEGTAVTLRPVRTHINSELCRACESCREICPFNAIELTSQANGYPAARIEPALCRGCNLCIAVCPTHATVASSHDIQWWQSELTKLDSHRGNKDVVLACQRRTGSLEGSIESSGSELQVIRFRCVGQVDAGMLLQLVLHGARNILVAGCGTDRCRFGEGVTTAIQQLQWAKRALKDLGHDESRLHVHWSANRAHDPLQSVLQEPPWSAGDGDRIG